MSKTGFQIANRLRPIVKAMIVDATLYGVISAGRAQRLIARLGLRSA